MLSVLLFILLLPEPEQKRYLQEHVISSYSVQGKRVFWYVVNADEQIDNRVNNQLPIAPLIWFFTLELPRDLCEYKRKWWSWTINKEPPTPWSKHRKFLSFVCFQNLCSGEDIRTKATKITKVHLDGHLMNNVTQKKGDNIQYRFWGKMKSFFPMFALHIYGFFQGR